MSFPTLKPRYTIRLKKAAKILDAAVAVTFHHCPQQVNESDLYEDRNVFTACSANIGGLIRRQMDFHLELYVTSGLVAVSSACFTTLQGRVVYENGGALTRGAWSPRGRVSGEFMEGESHFCMSDFKNLIPFLLTLLQLDILAKHDHFSY